MGLWCFLFGCDMKRKRPREEAALPLVWYPGPILWAFGIKRPERVNVIVQRLRCSCCEREALYVTIDHNGRSVKEPLGKWAKENCSMDPDEAEENLEWLS